MIVDPLPACFLPGPAVLRHSLFRHPLLRWTLGWAIVALLPIAALAQGDTARTARLGPIVTTAERAQTPVSSATSAVTRLSAAELARTPRATIADLLRLAPGVAVIDFDGLGFDPQLMVRGFYGGGDAEYVVVMVDGRQVNQVQSGVVAWDVLPPLASIEAIEVVRGSASPLYGDAAIGGVINVITRGAQGHALRWGVATGAFGVAQADLDASGAHGPVHARLSGGYDRTTGYRVHADRDAARASVGLRTQQGSRLQFGLRGTMASRDFDDPGPLLSSIADTARRASDVLFRFDHTRDRMYGGALDVAHMRTHLRTDLGVSYDAREATAIRTLALAPGFGDTKIRDVNSHTIAVTLQGTYRDTPLNVRDELVFGVDVRGSRLSSTYYRYVTGTRATYTPATDGSQPRATLDTDADARRVTTGAFAQYSIVPFESLRIVLGARWDDIHDTLHASVPATLESAARSHSAVSPKVGANWRFAQAGHGTFNAYATASRSFKAATLDQLYDLRNIPVPFPPFQIRTSNTELKPQHGTNVEGGLYHTGVAPSGMTGTFTLSAYEMRMTDELDFDVATLRYVNIGRSRHRGLELGSRIGTPSGANAFVNYTLQSAISRTGDTGGKQLKAIPRHQIVLGASRTLVHDVEAGFVVTHMRGGFLDDANTARLNNITRVDARVALHVLGAELFAEARNLLDAKYFSTGFPDPSGSGQSYCYPASTRTVQIGVRRGF
jgi:outer membrane receptor protein involved in Fe transport